MALSKDVHIERYGVGGNADQPLNFGIKGSTTVYRGSIALTASGVLKNSSSPASTDLCWGVVQQCGPESVDTGPGIVNGSSVDGVVSADVATGTFFMASGTSADQLSATTLGKTVYVIDEVTVGATSGSGTRPVAGVHVYTETRTQAPGNYAIKFGSGLTGPVGGP
jgi:hypothetical protein